jgi:hypothetical protein
MQPSRMKAIGSVVGLGAMITVVLFGASQPSAKAGPGPMYKLEQSTLKSGRSVVKRWNPVRRPSLMSCRLNDAGVSRLLRKLTR